jgi:CMP-N-acetylneuraminic acid synthetase
VVILGLIPARAGSKGIQRKNELALGGRTLIERTVDVARASHVIDRLVLTTDSETIAEIGRRAGIEVLMRPVELAGDDTPMLPVVQHAVAALEHDGEAACDAIALLQPTQPLRRPEHIRAAVELLAESGASSVASVVPIPSHYAPEYAMRIDHGNLVPYLPDAPPVARRQDVAAAYSRDGTIYLIRRETLRAGDLYGPSCKALVVPWEESVNLDTPGDWDRAAASLDA